MSIVELLVLAAFLLFPLFQQLLQKKQPPEQLPDDDQEDLAARRQADDTEAADEGWSAEWGAWPEEEGGEAYSDVETEVGPFESVASEERAREMIAYQERTPVDRMPEVARVTSPVVSLESVNVDRAAEHDRFHRTIGAPQRRGRGSRKPRVASLLRDRNDLRRGILLKEILGPAKGLQ